MQNKKKILIPLTAVVMGTFILNSCSTFQTQKIINADFKKVDKKLVITKTKKLKKVKRKKKAGRFIASADDGRTPNAERYQENGAQPETGKSGGRKLETRALLSSDGTTVLDISTGSISEGSVEDGTTITKVQIKAFNNEGEASFTDNVNDITAPGSYQYTTPQFKRHEEFQVQTNIKKSGHKRNYVVKTTNKVYLRPDLKVFDLQNPDQAYTEEPVEIIATVSELNMDVGARGDCVLKVDGAEAERAQGIWVDAGDHVTCIFEQSFASTGTKGITVSVENINPGDWDTSNNSVSGSIEIVDPTVAIQNLFMRVQGRTREYYYKYSYTNNSSTGSYNYSYNYARVYYNGHIPGASIAGGSPFIYDEITDGKTYTTQGNLPVNDGCSSAYIDCFNYHDYLRNRHFYVRNYKYPNQAPFTRIYARSYPTGAVYWGATGSYSYLNGRASGNADLFTSFGSNLAMDIQIESDGYTYQAQPSLNLTEYIHTNVDQKDVCDGYGHCYTRKDLYKSYYGTGTGN